MSFNFWDATNPASKFISIEPHAVARQKAIAKIAVSRGTVIAAATPLTTALISSEKGTRCDHCHLHASTSPASLMKCSACASFWYCSSACQKAQWQAHHRKICKAYGRFVASVEYQALSPNERVDVMLMSQLLAIAYPTDDFSSDPTQHVSIFFDLLQGPVSQPYSLPVCRLKRLPTPPSRLLEHIHARFGNNNFVIHSHLTTYAHGIFPLASRLFNHSCSPTCIARYIIEPDEPVKMEIVTIRDLAAGEEFTIPYLDPALPFQTRQDALEANYGFSCTCPLCMFQRNMELPVSPARHTAECDTLETRLCTYVDEHVLSLEQSKPVSPVGAVVLPTELHPLLDPKYLPTLSEEFSRTSHEREFEVALSSGRTLLALYAVVYPPYYPQIGMHALELAKTAWNAIIIHEEQHGDHGSPTDLTKRWETLARHYLQIATKVLTVFGPEGDEGGPLAELEIMRSLLQLE